MVRFRIANMNCGGCAKGVATTLKQVDPAAEPRFDLDRREVAIDKTAPDAALFEHALAAAGWQAERLAG